MFFAAKSIFGHFLFFVDVQEKGSDTVEICK